MTVNSHAVGHSKPTVCFLSCILPCNDTRVERIRTEVQRLGFRIVCIMPLPTNIQTELGDGICSLHPIEHFFSEGLPLFGLLQAIAGRIRNMLIALRHLIRARPDVVHCYEPDSWVLGIVMKRLTGCKVVVEFLETYDERASVFPRFSVKLIRWCIRRLLHVLSLRTDVVIHVSEARRALYPFLQARSTITLRYFPAREDFIESVDVARDPRLDGRFVVLHAGPLRPSYAASGLVEAIGKLRYLVPSILCLVLGGVREGLEHCSNLIQTLQNDGFMVVKQHMTFGDVAAFMSQSHVGVSLVLPVDDAHRYAFPRKFFEYLGAGLPVVCSDVPDLRKIVTDWSCGVIVKDSSDATSIAQAVLHLAESTHVRKAMAFNARRAFLARFNWHLEKSKLEAAYASLGVRRAVR